MRDCVYSEMASKPRDERGSRVGREHTGESRPNDRVGA